MYNPDGGSRLYLIADKVKGVQLAPLLPIFFSPGTIARNEAADEWTQREYSYEELPSEQFFDLYYLESGSSFSSKLSSEERDIHVASLDRAKQILAEHYPDSAPLRALMKKLDAAIGSMQAWAC